FLQDAPRPDHPLSLSAVLGPWDNDPHAISGAMVLWTVAAGFMLVGLGTRAAVLIVWLLSVSFKNMNSYNDNAGDLIRTIALLYLVLTPCGAAWSVDRWLARWWRRENAGPARPVYVSPWALRLLLIQMAYIYCCNGLFKALGTLGGRATACT